jgi:hypothetical protein
MASAVVVAALVGTLAVSMWGHRGSPSSQLDLNPGTAWFADEAAGTVSLLDGATASRISEQSVPGARASDDLVVEESGIQSGSGAYVMDRRAGTVSYVDGATLLVDNQVTPSPAGNDKDLSVASNARPNRWIPPN